MKDTQLLQSATARLVALQEIAKPTEFNQRQERKKNPYTKAALVGTGVAGAGLGAAYLRGRSIGNAPFMPGIGGQVERVKVGAELLKGDAMKATKAARVYGKKNLRNLLRRASSLTARGASAIAR